MALSTKHRWRREEMRRRALVAVALLLVLAGCKAPPGQENYSYYAGIGRGSKE